MTKKLLIILFPFVVVLTSYIFYRKEPLELLVNNKINPDYGISIYNDQNKGGASEIKLLSREKGIFYELKLSPKIQYPFAGLSFFSQKNNFIDLTGYDEVRFKISSASDSRIAVMIYTNIEGHSKRNDFDSFLNNQFVLNPTKDASIIDIPLSDFKTPDWWYRDHKTSEKEIGKPDYSKVKYISFNASDTNHIHSTETILLESFIFYKSQGPFFIYTGLFILVYFWVYILLKTRKTNTVTEINFTYQKTEHGSRFEKDEILVFDYLTSNYHNPALSISHVQNAISLSEQKISAIILKKTQLNFKSFLNKLRITEAKRLLQETDMQISEIAFGVGYSNVTHFNRVFKERENCTPNDYRKAVKTGL